MKHILKIRGIKYILFIHGDCGRVSISSDSWVRLCLCSLLLNTPHLYIVYSTLLLFFIAQYVASMHIGKLTRDNPHILAKLLGFLGALIPIELVGGLWTILLILLG